jgi:hypothetical protein
MRNLVAFEQVFKDQLYSTIQQLNKIITVGAAEVGYRNALQEYKEKWGKALGPLANFSPTYYYFWKWAPQLASWEARRINGLRFETYFKDVFGADDIEGSIAKFRSRLCIQTLSFQDKARYRDICRGAEIKSVFDELDSEHKLSANYDALYEKFTKDDRPLLSRLLGWGGSNNNTATNKVGANVCAWRDYNRRNLVFWLTRKVRNDEE